jgi:hypothetical protein
LQQYKRSAGPKSSRDTADTMPNSNERKLST